MSATDYPIVFDPIVGRTLQPECFYNRTNAWDGTDWWGYGTCANKVRSLPLVAYDSVRQVVVLFGGLDGTVGGQTALNDTWEFSRGTWTQKTQNGAAFNPPGNYATYSAMVYDSRRQLALLLLSAGVAVREWNGTSWHSAPEYPTTPTPPSARSGFAAVYDSARKVTVLFGGKATAGGTLLNETWEMDGVYWNQRFPAVSPPARYLHAMAYDSARGVTVLFGGCGSTSCPFSAASMGDTWEWDGTNWTQRFPAASPPARSQFGMTYDSLRGVTVMMGGQSIVNSIAKEYQDVWEWKGTAP